MYNKDVIGIAQAGQPTVRRSRKQAEKSGSDEVDQPGRLPPDTERIAIPERRLRTMILTSLQRDFLDRYCIECVYCRTESTYARELARQHGFTYEHMRRLWDIYCQSWGSDLSKWEDVVPPVSPPPDPPIFPWASIQELEEQLQAAEAGRHAVSA